MHVQYLLIFEIHILILMRKNCIKNFTQQLLALGKLGLLLCALKLQKALFFRYGQISSAFQNQIQATMKILE